MKLLAKITLLNLLLAIAAFTFGGYRVYHKFKNEVERETDLTILASYYQLVKSIRSGVVASDLENHFVRITPVESIQPGDTINKLSDTLFMHPTLKRLELFRKLEIAKTINGKTYRFMVVNVIIEQSDIARIAKLVVVDLFMVLGIILLFFNFIFSRWLFIPFKETLQKIRSFNLHSPGVPVFPKTTTTEFKQLNDFLSNMLHKAQQDYRSLKEFSENASHELQTPLAVANGKLELLMESPGLNESQIQWLQDAKDALLRMSKLGESLLLLTKIENQEFKPVPVDLSKILQKEVRIFSDLASMKGLRFHTEILPSVMVRMDASLAHILIGNLLKNAVRHNVEAGWIEVRLTLHSLVVRNSGQPPPVPTERLFARFQKSNQSGKSLGVGLAIVKKICDVNGIGIKYHYIDEIHELICSF